jgi:hypothetical protein
MERNMQSNSNGNRSNSIKHCLYANGAEPTLSAVIPGRAVATKSPGDFALKARARNPSRSAAKWIPGSPLRGAPE